MYGTFFKAIAKSGRRDELLKFFKKDAEVADSSEPDTLRFDVWPVSGEPDALFVYETYTDVTGFKKHQANAPYQEFKNRIEPDMLEPDPKPLMVGFTDSLASNDDDRVSSSTERDQASELLN